MFHETYFFMELFIRLIEIALTLLIWHQNSFYVINSDLKLFINSKLCFYKLIPFEMYLIILFNMFYALFQLITHLIIFISFFLVVSFLPLYRIMDHSYIFLVLWFFQGFVKFIRLSSFFLVFLNLLNKLWIFNFYYNINSIVNIFL